MRASDQIDPFKNISIAIVLSIVCNITRGRELHKKAVVGPTHQGEPTPDPGLC